MFYDHEPGVTWCCLAQPGAQSTQVTLLLMSIFWCKLVIAQKSFTSKAFSPVSSHKESGYLCGDLALVSKLNKVLFSV